MDHTIREKLDLPPIDQVGFVVRDLDAAIAMYEPLFGPFSTMDSGEFEYDYRGRKDTSSLKLAFGRSGDVEIELIQWVSGGTPHKEFIDAGREGMHHLRFRVDNLDDLVGGVRQYPVEDNCLHPHLSQAGNGLLRNTQLE